MARFLFLGSSELLGGILYYVSIELKPRVRKKPDNIAGAPLRRPCHAANARSR